MTARRLKRTRAPAALRLTTPEPAPLAIFGAVGSSAVGRELDDAGVGFTGGVVPSFQPGEQPIVSMWPTSQRLTADRVVALPRRVAREIPDCAPTSRGSS
jgi:hypothetical protein